MKKIVFIFFVIFLLTGCSNNVEFEFNEKDIKSKVSFSFTLDEYKAHLNEPNLSDSEAKSRIESIINFRNAFTDPYSDLFEEKSYMNNGKYYQGLYEYTYTYENFSDNSVLNSCFEYFGVEEDEETIYILVKGKSNCAPFKLKVTVKDRMVSSNENDKDDNQYIWNIKENDNDVYMAISKAPIVVVQEEPELFSVMDLIYLFIALIIAIVAIVLKKKYKESN